MLKTRIETFVREHPFWGVFLITFLLLYLRLLYQSSYYPSYFGGEEAAVLDKVVNACSGIHSWKFWWETIVVMSKDYAKGYSWILAPFYRYFGYDWRLVIWIIPFFTCLFCSGYFAFHRMAYPSRSSVFSFLMVIGFALFVLCVRRYKWHGMSYPAVFSFYLYFLPHFCAYRLPFSKVQIRLWAVLLFVASCFFYFGNIIYAVPALFFVLCFDVKKDWKFKIVLAGLGLAVIAAVTTWAFALSQVWTDRLINITLSTRQLLSPDRLEIRIGSVQNLFTVLFSPPFQVLAGLGFIVSFIRMLKSDRFASINLVLFGWTYVIQFLLHGGSNLDSLNWSMLPLFGILLAGSDVLFCALRDRIRFAGILFAIPVIMVWWNECRLYPLLNQRIPYQQCIYPQDTTTQAALVLRMIKEDGSGLVHYYLPDPSVRVELGGFNYANNLKRVEFKQAFSRVTFFKSLEDLRRKRIVPPEQRYAVAYLSVFEKIPDGEVRDKKSILPELPFEMVHPYESIYRIRFNVRKYQVE